MRTNHDLLREILIMTADHDGSFDLSTGSYCELPYSRNLIGYHIKKLIEVGYLTAIDARSKTDEYGYLCIELTMSGENYLEKIEDDGVWEQTKTYLKDNAISLTFDSILAAVKLFL